MTEKHGWYVVDASVDNVTERGPFPLAVMEDMARQGHIVESTMIAHAKYTKGRAIEARRVSRLYDIFAATHESHELIEFESPVSISKQELAHAPSDRGEVGIGRFMADGQDPDMIVKLAERVDGICTRDENPLYMAVQQKPVANFSPDAVVLTNRRVIIFRQKVLGRLQFVDVLWINVHDVHFSENVVGSTIYVRGTNGHVEEIAFLPKEQARKVYRIAQDMEEAMIELRRERGERGLDNRGISGRF